MSKTTIYIHVVFTTKNREASIPTDQLTTLYKFVWHFLVDRNCRLLRIGGLEDHVHILFNLNPTQALSTLMKELKSSTSGWMMRDERFPYFEGWSSGYYAGSISPEVKDRVIEYIKDQRAHHHAETCGDEIMRLGRCFDFIPDPRDLI